MGELLPESAKQDHVTAAIVWNDVAIDSTENPTLVRIHLRRSKCDQFGAGANIILGRTGHSLCPVTVIIVYIAIRGSGPRSFFPAPMGPGSDEGMVCGPVTCNDIGNRTTTTPVCRS